jgi:phosphotransacetylase
MSMDITEQLQIKAKANPKRVVFPEADEAKILHAARQAHDIGIAYPMLVGRSENLFALARSIGVSLDGITVVDHTQQERVERFVTEYTKRNPDFPASATRRMLRDPLNFAAMMVLLGDADCVVAGLAHTTEEVIMASEMIIGLQEGISTVSSMVIASIPGYEGSEGSLLAFADCVVCPAPTPCAVSWAGSRVSPYCLFQQKAVPVMRALTKCWRLLRSCTSGGRIC